MISRRVALKALGLVPALGAGQAAAQASVCDSIHLPNRPKGIRQIMRKAKIYADTARPGWWTQNATRGLSGEKNCEKYRRIAIDTWSAFVQGVKHFDSESIPHRNLLKGIFKSMDGGEETNTGEKLVDRLESYDHLDPFDGNMTNYTYAELMGCAYICGYEAARVQSTTSNPQLVTLRSYTEAWKTVQASAIAVSERRARKQGYDGEPKAVVLGGGC
ncbi:MAG: hypothetical protein AAF458_05305 [Pseudomonadota bacterium]